MSDLGKFIGGFGEGFVKTLESERKRKKEEDQFNQDMAFKYRQQNLMNIHYQQQEKRLQESEAREKDLQELGIRSQYQEISPEPNMPLLPIIMGGVAGGERNKNFDALKPFQEGKFYAPKQAEGKTNFEFKSKYNPQRGINEIFWVDKNNPDVEPKYYGDEKPDKGSGDGQNNRGDKEPKLTEAGATGLANLKSPNFIENNTYMTPEKAKNVFQRSLQALTKDVLSSRASNWFYNISEKWGRVPTADELDKEIVKHYEGKNKTLTVFDVAQLNRLVEYLETAEEGINKYRNYEDKIKKLSEKK